MRNSFDYSVLRVVPCVEREEFFNVGAVVFCAQRAFLHARISLDPRKLAILAPMLIAEDLQRHLDAVVKICAGDPEAGPVARLSQRARFHWLVAPRSTVIQPSPVHSGICGDEPGPVLDRLFREQVLDSAGASLT